MKKTLTVDVSCDSYTVTLEDEKVTIEDEDGEVVQCGTWIGRSLRCRRTGMIDIIALDRIEAALLFGASEVAS